MHDLNTKVIDKRFSFGSNWESYSKHINEERIHEAIAALSKLIPLQCYQGKTFLDIGCGSGLHSLAALRLGFTKVVALDIDPSSVRTTQQVLQNHAPNQEWSVQELSIFDANPDSLGTFDVVYSWGVLHHTGDMYNAIRCAAKFVKPNGLLALALYRKTLLCTFWKWEKRLYNNGPAWFPKLSQFIFKSLFLTRLILKGSNPLSYIHSYKQNRGMDWHHDIIDWIGGYPYESISVPELKTFAKTLNFEVIKEFTQKQRFGLFGAGCDEYCLRAKG